MTDRHRGRLLSARDAQRVLGIPEGTVRSWYHRRKWTGLWDIGRDNRGHPLFYETDLLALKSRRKLRDKTGRRKEAASEMVTSTTPDNEPCDPSSGVRDNTGGTVGRPDPDRPDRI